MTIFWNEAILQFDENSGQTPAVFVCAGEVSGFSAGGGSVASSETGRLLGRAGIGTWIWSFWWLVSAEGGGICAYGFVRRTFRCFRGGRAQH